MTLRQRVRFYQQLSVLVRAGLPLRAGMQRLKERMAVAEIATLSQQLDAGERLGEAFIRAGFSTFECHLVVAGERSGQLDTVFEHLGEFWKRQFHMADALIRPLYYPIFVLHMAVLLSALIEALTTSWAIAVPHLILRLAVIYVAGFVIYILVRVMWSNETGRNVLLHVPVIGTAMRCAYAFRWITALRLEFVAGISLPNAVADAWRASGYLDAEKLALEGQHAMREGIALSALVQRWKRLPRDWTDFMETGEISGALEASFKSLEAEASRAWTLAEERMASWLPKMAYYLILLVVAVQVGMLMYQVEVKPIVDAEAQIDKATNGG